MVSELIAAADFIRVSNSKDQINDSARYPKRPHIKSGYIMISKNELLKSKILKNIAEIMILNRAKSKGK